MTDWANPTLVDLKQLFSFPDSRFTAEPWHQALQRGDVQATVDAFVKNLRQGPSRTERALSMPTVTQAFNGVRIGFNGGHNLDPDMVINRHYVGAYGIEHRFEGEIDWWTDPTRDWGDHHTWEWIVQFNRHYQWVPLADRYEQTRDARYAQAWEHELRTWVTQCPRPADNGMDLPSTWRLIEVGIRMGWTWPYAFETFRRSPHVSDQAIWLMAATMFEHGMHLLLWPTKRNFKSMESNGLVHVGVAFPEFRLGRTFLMTGLDRIIAELERQVYDDGLQDELAPSYGVVALLNFYIPLQQIRCYFQRADSDFGLETPHRTMERLASMVEALAILTPQDGRTPPLHDSPAHSISPIYRHFAEHLDPERFNHELWKQNGLFHLPWGGYAVSRRDVRYSLFDAGPWGSGHQHSDALQLLTWSDGRWFCADPGKPLYNQSPLTRYMKSSEAHNVVVMDGRRHMPLPMQAVLKTPLPMALDDTTPVWISAAKRHAVTCDDQAATTFAHERIMLDVPKVGWIVFDRLQACDDRPHTWRWSWHTPVDRLDVVDGVAACAAYDQGPCQWIVPVGAALVAEVCKGRKDPTPLGWQRRGDTSSPTPALTLTYTSEPTAGAFNLCTLIIPQAQRQKALPVVPAKLEVNGDTVRLTLSDGSMFNFVGRDQVERITYHLADGVTHEVMLPSHEMAAN